MAKNLLLVSLLLYIAVAEAVPVPAEWSAPANKRINDMQLKVDRALKDVIAAAPPVKRSEAEKATLLYKNGLSVILSKAKAAGDEKKAISIADSYEEAADLVIAAQAPSKFNVMESRFPGAAAPDLTKCPNVDKSYCETYSKYEDVVKGVLDAAPPAKSKESWNALFDLGSEVLYNINKAYATGDEKEIARVLAAYNKAADAVIAAAPAEKFKVMEETYAAANKA